MQTNIPNKTSTLKYPRLNGKQRFMEKDGFETEWPNSRQGKAFVNQKTSCGNNIGPKMLGHVHLKQ